jgi:hypothetical protein
MCPCVKTALNRHLSYIPPMLMLKISDHVGRNVMIIPYMTLWVWSWEVSVDACALCIRARDAVKAALLLLLLSKKQ